MKTSLILVAVLIAISACRNTPAEPHSSPAGQGSVRGHVRFEGPATENEPIRMNADPMCANAAGGRPVVDEAVVASADGSLANAFVELVGTFPDTPVPSEPVSINQNGCVYEPRMVAVRAGQTLQVRNSDDGLHNVHGIASDHDAFNVSQPVKDMVNIFHPQEPGVLRLKCDVHTWMVAFVGVANHPFFAVTGKDGTFVLQNVPAGTYDVRAWHERFGAITSKVHVDAGQAADVDLMYSAHKVQADQR